VESNGGTERNHQKHHVEMSGLPNVYFLMESGRSKRPGVFTTDHTKETCVNLIQELLELKKIAFHTKFLTCCSGKLATVGNIQEKLLKQLSSFDRITTPNANPLRPAKIEYSGKRSGMDDMVMALFLALLSMRLFKQNRALYENNPRFLDAQF